MSAPDFRKHVKGNIRIGNHATSKAAVSIASQISVPKREHPIRPGASLDIGYRDEELILVSEGRVHQTASDLLQPGNVRVTFGVENGPIDVVVDVTTY